MDLPLITVITAAYNGQRTIAHTLQSVLNQDYTHFEMWVVGDGCKDNSEAVVKSFQDSRIKWINLSENSGSQSAPNNEGLRRAKGEYIAFVGQDDLWFPWHLSDLVRLIESGNADFVHSLGAGIGKNGYFWPKGPPVDGSNYKYHNVPPSTWLHKRDVVEKIGNWQPANKLSWPIDFDITRRAYLAGLNFDFSPRLSVLKFPSPIWNTYNPESKLPQEEFAKEMIADPDKLAFMVLQAMCISTSRVPPRNYRKPVDLAYSEFKKSTAGLVNSAIFALLERYGLERWPVGNFIRNRYSRNREKKKKIRGL